MQKTRLPQVVKGREMLKKRFNNIKNFTNFLL